MSINVATLIGHNTVRETAMGGDFDRATHARRNGEDEVAGETGDGRRRSWFVQRIDLSARGVFQDRMK